MKKTLIATAALLSLQATAVSAANVNIYGVIEEGILVQKADGANATTELKSAFDLGSRVGLKGSEDLGNGVKVGFILESGFLLTLAPMPTEPPALRVNRYSTFRATPSGGWGLVVQERSDAVSRALTCRRAMYS